MFNVMPVGPINVKHGAFVFQTVDRGNHCVIGDTDKLYGFSKKRKLKNV